MEAEAEPQLEVEAVKKIGLLEQCEADDHVTDNTDLECDPVDYSRYNKVASLCLGGHREYSKNHHEDKMEQASPKFLWKPQSAETESQWMNDVVTEQKYHQKFEMAKPVRICSWMLSNSVPSLIRVSIIKI